MQFWTTAEQEISLGESAHMSSSTKLQESDIHSSSLNQWEKGGCWLLFNQTKKTTGFNQFSARLAFSSIVTKHFDELEFNDQYKRAFGFIPERKTALDKLQFSEACQVGLKQRYSLLTYQLETNIKTATLIKIAMAVQNIEIDITVMEFPDFSKAENISGYDLIVCCEVLDTDVSLSLFDFYTTNVSIKKYFSAKACNDLQHLCDLVLKDQNYKEQLLEIEDHCLKKLYWLPLTHYMQQVSIHAAIQGASLQKIGWVGFAQLWRSDL